MSHYIKSFPFFSYRKCFEKKILFYEMISKKYSEKETECYVFYSRTAQISTLKTYISTLKNFGGRLLCYLAY